jgi:hypothetical protein
VLKEAKRNMSQRDVQKEVNTKSPWKVVPKSAKRKPPYGLVPKTKMQCESLLKVKAFKKELPNKRLSWRSATRVCHNGWWCFSSFPPMR